MDHGNRKAGRPRCGRPYRQCFVKRVSGGQAPRRVRCRYRWATECWKIDALKRAEGADLTKWISIVHKWLEVHRRSCARKWTGRADRDPGTRSEFALDA